MAETAEYTPLNLLTNERTDWKVCVKVFVTWKKTYYNNPSAAMSFELIFVDVQGNKIRGTVNKNLISFFENIFKEGSFFYLSDFGITSCDDKVSLVDHEWKIILYRTSKVVRCPSFQMLSDGFNIVSFDRILEWKLNNAQVFDVVGRLVDMNPMRVKREKGVDTKSIEFILKDNSGQQIKCALWAHHASNLFQFVSARKNNDDPIYVLMHNCKVRDWQGFPQVSNQLWGCRVYLNEDIPPIRRFKAEYEVALESSPHVGEKIADIKAETIFQTAIDLFSKHQPKSIADVVHINEVSNCIIRGRVQKVNDDEGWFTFTCTKCNKKVTSRYSVETSDSIYECDVCGVTKDVYPRIRTTIRVADKTGECTLVLFASQLSKMVKKSVSWLMEKALSVADPNNPPSEFNDILQNPYVWHIRITDFNIRFNYYGFTVENVTDDKEVFQVIDDKIQDGCSVDNRWGQSSEDISATKNVMEINTVIDTTGFANVTCPLESEVGMYNKRDVKTCKELSDISELTKCVVKAKVICVHDEEGWFSFSCVKCNKNAGPKFGHNTVDGEYECDNCGVVKDVVPRIRLAVHIGDETGHVPLILFENQVSKMLKKSTEWLAEKAKKSADPNKLPLDMFDIMDASYVWLIRVTDFKLTMGFPALTAVNVTDSEEVIQVVDRKLSIKKPIVDDAYKGLVEVTPIKLEPGISDSCAYPSSSDGFETPNSNTKRKPESPLEDPELDTPTCGTSDGIAAMKIPRMDSL